MEVTTYYKVRITCGECGTGKDLSYETTPPPATRYACRGCGKVTAFTSDMLHALWQEQGSRMARYGRCMCNRCGSTAIPLDDGSVEVVE